MSKRITSPLVKNLRADNIHGSAWAGPVRDAVGFLVRSERSADAVLSKIRAIRPLVDGMDTRVTCVEHASAAGGYSMCGSYFLDARVALIVCNAADEEDSCDPKIIVGLEFPKDGVAISQIQLAEPRGNRFLFKLRPNFVEAVIRWIDESFKPRNLHLIDGLDVVRRNLESYACVTHRDRVLALGDAEIASWINGERDIYDIVDGSGCCLEMAGDGLTSSTASRMIRSYNRGLEEYRRISVRWMRLQPHKNEPKCLFYKLRRVERRHGVAP